MSDPPPIPADRLTSCVDAVLEKLANGSPADGLIFVLVPPFSVREVNEALAFIRRMDAIPKIRAKH